MDFLTLFVGKQLYRLQVVRPAFRLLGVLHFGTGEDKGDLLILLIFGHIKSNNFCFETHEKKE